MTPYTYAGCIIRASQVFVFVNYGEGDTEYMWLPISKNDARLITADAKEEGAAEIDAEMRGTELFVGGAALDEANEDDDDAGDPDDDTDDDTDEDDDDDDDPDGDG